MKGHSSSPHLDFRLWFDCLPLPGSWMPQVDEDKLSRRVLDRTGPNLAAKSAQNDPKMAPQNDPKSTKHRCQKMIKVSIEKIAQGTIHLGRPGGLRWPPGGLGASWAALGPVGGDPKQHQNHMQKRTTSRPQKREARRVLRPHLGPQNRQKSSPKTHQNL